MMNNRVTRIIANSVGLAAVAALGITVYQLGTSPIKEEAPREQTESTDQEEQKQDTDEQSMVDVGTSQVESENHPLSGDEENLDNTESTSANGTTDGEIYGNTVDNNDVDGTAYVDNENSVVGENDSNAQQGKGISSMNTGDGASIASDSETTDVSASAINLPEINFSEDTLMEWPVNGNILLDYSMDQTTYFSHT